MATQENITNNLEYDWTLLSSDIITKCQKQIGADQKILSNVHLCLGQRQVF